ncbi:MAG: type II toxin-antitoxin system Phd/YefM family antitoxin [Coriobacteriia bacterium]|nr:type II toxin-antitoxin system Phd/YefM family antitoxin [Coriobacteriia bacterium]
MTTVSVTEARSDLYNLIKEVNDSSIPALLTNRKGQNAVLISEDDWRSIEETMYLNSIPGVAESIIKEGNTSIEECTPVEDINL